jgi:predicted RNA-binding Zn-ribbon protein involved in translation (DUF1610 family)
MSERLSTSKRCKVCGGNVSAVDGQSPFGYCDSCGIVYALKDRLNGQWSKDAPRGIELGPGGRLRETDRPRGATLVDTEEDSEPSNSHWKCPDCDAELNAANDADLWFAKREHIREYHPNRSIG